MFHNSLEVCVHKLSSMVKCNATGFFLNFINKWPPNNVLLIFLSYIIIIKYELINNYVAWYDMFQVTI